MQVKINAWDILTLFKSSLWKPLCFLYGGLFEFNFQNFLKRPVRSGHLTITIITSLPLSPPSRLLLFLCCQRTPMTDQLSGHLPSLHAPAKQEEGVPKPQASSWRLVKRGSWRNAWRVGATRGRKAHHENSRCSAFFHRVGGHTGFPKPWGTRSSHHWSVGKLTGQNNVVSSITNRFRSSKLVRND